MRYKWGDLISLEYGKPVPDKESPNGNVPVFGTNGPIGASNLPPLCKHPSFTVGRKGAYRGVYYSDIPFSVIDTAFFVENKRPDILLIKWAYYKFLTYDINRMDSGSAIPSTDRYTIYAIEVEVPSVITQAKQVAILDALSNKIVVNQQENDNLQQIAQAVFNSWFVDYAPFDELFAKSPIGLSIPESLKMVQICDLDPIIETGKRPKGGASKSGIPSIGAENVKELGKVSFSSNKFIPPEFACKLKTGRVNGYELMLYKDGGKPGTFTPHFSMFGEGFPYDEFYINEHVFKVDFRNRGFNEFAYFYFQTEYPYHWLANNGGKAAIPGINRQDILSMWIYSPDHPIIQKYCEWVQPIFTTILKNCAQNVRLSSLRDTLLPRLMSGELDVSGLDI